MLVLVLQSTRIANHEQALQYIRETRTLNRLHGKPKQGMGEIYT